MNSGTTFDASTMIKDTSSLNSLIISIKNGNEKLREELISKYKPYIKRIIYDVMSISSNENIESMDEYSIALIAFNEAIERYEIKKNVNFFTYAALVIKSRLYSYIKKNRKYSMTYSFSSFDETMNVESHEGISMKMSVFDVYEENDNIQDELDNLKNKLLNFNISFADLIESVPKHKDSKLFCIELANKIVENKKIFEKIYFNYIFPKKEIIKLTGVNKKTIERNRKFLIALVIIIGSGYRSIRSYIEIQ